MAKSKVDQTDLQILAQLDLDGRATAAEIGRELNINKNTVNSRIKDLEAAGIITPAPIVDFLGLGYVTYRLFFKLQHTNRTIEQEMIDYLKNSQFVRWGSLAQGAGFDMDVLAWFKTSEQLNNFWTDFRSKFKNYIKDACIAQCCSEIRSGLPFTRDGHNISIGTNGQLKIDETDGKILRYLSGKGRAPLSEIAKTVGLTDSGVKYRIDRLLKRKVIGGFRPLVDLRKFGYRMYRVGLNLDSLDNCKKIEQFTLGMQNVVNVLGNVGGADLEFIFHVKSEKELHDSIHLIQDSFSQDMRDYNFLTYPDAFKEAHMPEF